MNTPAALYAYFGYLGDFSTDIPGHTFYQIGLIDQLCKHHQIDKVDFYSYLSHDQVGATQKSPIWPTSPVTPVFEKFTKERIRSYNLGFAKVAENIEKGRYDKIFLKARFRNLSTLTKQLTDARQFELLIKAAIQTCQDAGIKVIMATGDHPETAKNIAHQVGLAEQKETIVLHGNTLQKISTLKDSEINPR